MTDYAEDLDAYVADTSIEPLPSGILKPLNQDVSQLLADIAAAPLRFSVLNVERMIDDSAKHLQRCLTYRSSAQELEDQAVRSMLEQSVA